MELLQNPTVNDWAVIKEHLLKHIKDFNSLTVKVLNFFIIEGDNVWVPRWFASQFFNIKLITEQKKTFTLSFNCTLMATAERPQQLVFDNAINSLTVKGAATIVLPCGTGKTNIAIAIALELGVKTAILCHSNLLIDQWKERLIELVPNCKIGIIQQKQLEIEDKHFVICSIPSLVSRMYANLQFGLVIVDEAHHIPAHTFFTALKSLSCDYTLGLTATPKRRDKLEDIIYWSLGPICYQMVPIHNNNVQVNIIAFESGNGKEIKYRNGHIGISKMVTNLTKDKLRNKLLLSLINKLKQTNRKGLLLSDRVDHLKYIYSQLNCPDYSEIVTGKYCTDERKGKQLEFPKLLTLSTFHLFSEAIDFGGDFIILATPKSNIEQAVGRILRGQKTTYRPAVFDIVDTFSIFGNMRWKRNHFYKQQGFEVIHLNEHVFI